MTWIVRGGVGNAKGEAARGLRRVRGWEEEQARIREMVCALPADGGERLMRLERRVRRPPPSAGGIISISEHWTTNLYRRR